MSLLTTEQMLAYREFEDRFPDHLSPVKLADGNGVYGLFFVQGYAEDMDCDDECGMAHVRYVVILPEGEVLNGVFSEFITSNTLGEEMRFGRPVFDSAEPVLAEDWPATIVESDPWLDDLGY